MENPLYDTIKCKTERSVIMGLLFVILIIAGIFVIYDSIRQVNKNILAQTEEIKRLREEIQEIQKIKTTSAK